MTKSSGFIQGSGCLSGAAPSQHLATWGGPIVIAVRDTALGLAALAGLGHGIPHPPEVTCVPAITMPPPIVTSGSYWFSLRLSGS